jgi:hypothetical protein
MVNYKLAIHRQLDCLIATAADCSASNLVMEGLALQVSHVRDLVEEAFLDSQQQDSELTKSDNVDQLSLF